MQIIEAIPVELGYKTLIVRRYNYIEAKRGLHVLLLSTTTTTENKSKRYEKQLWTGIKPSRGIICM